MVLETAFPCETIPHVQSPSFPDVAETDWFNDIAADAKAKGIIVGVQNPKYADPIFEGNRAITRAEAVKIVVAAGATSTVPHYLNAYAALPSSASVPDASEFVDVTDPNVWFYPYVYASKSAGIIQGYGDGTNRFGPNDDITRGQAATIIYRASGY